MPKAHPSLELPLQGVSTTAGSLENQPVSAPETHRAAPLIEGTSKVPIALTPSSEENHEHKEHSNDLDSKTYKVSFHPDPSQWAFP